MRRGAVRCAGGIVATPACAVASATAHAWMKASRRYACTGAAARLVGCLLPEGRAGCACTARERGRFFLHSRSNGHRRACYLPTEAGAALAPCILRDTPERELQPPDSKGAASPPCLQQYLPVFSALLKCPLPTQHTLASAASTGRPPSAVPRPCIAGEGDAAGLAEAGAVAGQEHVG
jgi:hypothetical protein